MRILVVGAGAIGGYFGGRLLQAKRDVTFLVRERRAAQLKQTGLALRSPLGDVDLPDPPVIQAHALHQPFDLILLSCKAYDLQSAIESFAPAVGPGSAILPLLNGIRHLEALESRFGSGVVLGGQCVISAALDAQGRVLHLNDLHTLTFGERSGGTSARAQAILGQLAGAGFEARVSATILREMWEKWVFIAAAAGINCLMRAAIGDIVAAGATPLAVALYEECAQVAADAGFAPSESLRRRSLAALTQAGSPLTASMLRDVESRGRTESEQILEDLLRRQRRPVGEQSLLAIACTHLRTYEIRRQREQSSDQRS